MWNRSKVEVTWDDSYKKFNYVRQPLTHNEEQLWKDAGYTNQHFTGMMYDSRNPMPIWCDIIANKIGLTNCGFVLYKMTTGIIMPTHVDHFSKYCQVFRQKKENVFRAIVFLENWKPGHYFEIDGNPIVNYTAGEYILWSNDMPHAASNIGLEDRHTLQITGIKL